MTGQHGLSYRPTSRRYVHQNIQGNRADRPKGASCSNSFLTFSGMSTVPEALAAHQCGMTVFAFSLITNECILNDDVEDGPTAEEVIESGERRDGRLMRSGRGSCRSDPSFSLLMCTISGRGSCGHSWPRWWGTWARMRTTMTTRGTPLKKQMWKASEDAGALITSETLVPKWRINQ